MYLMAIYAKSGGTYDVDNANRFGRKMLGYQWADWANEAVEKFAAKKGLDASQLEA